MKQLWLYGLIIMCFLAACSNNQSASPDELESSKNQSEASSQDETSKQDDSKKNKANAEEKSSDDKDSSKDTSQDESKEDQTSENASSTDEDSKDQSSEDKQADQTDQSKDSEATKEDVNKGFNQYRPNEGLKKTFIQDEEYELTYDIVAVNNTHVQRIVKFGDIITLQILKWTSEGASIVYQEQNPKDTSSQLTTYDPYEPPVKIVDVNKKGEGSSEQWEVIHTNEMVKVPYDTFNHVYVVRQTLTSESSGSKTVITDYYAKGLGMIKETREVKGDNGYTSISVLDRVKK